MANTYTPRNVPSVRMSYADMVDERDRAFREAGGTKSYRSPVRTSVTPSPPPAATAQVAPPVVLQAVQPAAAPAVQRGGYPAITPVRRSALTNDASLEDKIADNARGTHLDADGRPARWNVPMQQIEGRDVSTSRRLFATQDSIPQPAAVQQPPAGVVAPPVPAALPSVPDASPREALPTAPPALQQTSVRPVPVINLPRQPVPIIDVNNAPSAPQPGYGGLMGAASAVRRVVPQVARDVASDVRSIVRQALRAADYVAGGSRGLAEGDAARASSAASEQALTGNLRIHQKRQQDAARHMGFSARPASALPPGSQYTRRVFGPQP